MGYELLSHLEINFRANSQSQLKLTNTIQFTPENENALLNKGGNLVGCVPNASH
jgi:hypothetical protein